MFGWSIENPKTIFWGIVWLVLATVFVLHEAGNPFNELALIINSRTASGRLAKIYDMEAERNDRVYPYELGVYSFSVPNGQKYKASTTGDIAQHVQVEYLPGNPAVNRVKGDGAQNLFEFLWRKVGVGGILLALLVSPGFSLVRAGFKRGEDNENQHQAHHS